MCWRIAAVGAFALLGACARVGAPPPPDAVYDGYRREVDQRLTERPFAHGAIAVLASEDGAMRTWTLVPCQGGAAICGGHEGGPVGQVRQTEDYYVVDGLYGRRFWLGWGGDGYVERGGTYRPIAWDARRNGEGPGYDPVLETPDRHF